MISAGLMFPGITFLDGNMFNQVIIYCNRDIVIDFVNFL